MPVPIVPLAVGGAQAISGLIKGSRARRELKELEGQRPESFIPPSLIEFADAPISETYLQNIADMASRRVGTGVSALQKGGSRTLAQLPTLFDQERVGERQLAGDISQRQLQASTMLGQAQMTKQQQDYNRWLAQVQGAQGQRADADKFIFGGMGSMANTFLASQFQPQQQQAQQQQPFAPPGAFPQQPIAPQGFGGGGGFGGGFGGGGDMAFDEFGNPMPNYNMVNPNLNNVFTPPVGSFYNFK